jgi:uncharacterized protein YbjT (DUF2867 family)
MKIRAIVLGASGMVGEGVLIEALKHGDVESVLVVGRRPCGVTHGKLKELIHNDFYNFSTVEGELTGYNACFFCLGVSSLGMNEQDYTRTTYDLTMHVATTLSRLDPGMTFCYVSGAGTDSSEHGRLMWARVKGRTENDLTKLPFKAVYLFRPGLLKPNSGQKNLKTIFKAVGVLYPVAKALSPKNACTLEEMGLAMIHTVTAGYAKRILEVPDIVQLART